MNFDEEYFQDEEFQEILKKYEAAVESGHMIYMDADDLADIADYYQYNGKPDEADTAVELALRYNPDAVGPLLYKARQALILHDFESARDYALHIESVDHREAQYLKGEILICEDKSDEADLHFINQMEEIPHDELKDYIYDIANIYADYQLFDKTFEWLARSQGDNSDDFKELVGETMFGLGRYKDSERIYNELLDKDPYSTRYWKALASSQYMREDYGAALTSSEYAIAINPDDAEGVVSKANSLYNLGQYEEALACYERFSKLIPNDEYGYLYQGTCLINLGKPEEALQKLEEARTCAPGDSNYLPEIYQELAFVNSELKRPETAIYYLDQTEPLDCDHANIDIIRGHILLTHQRYEEAEQAYQSALAKSNDQNHTLLRIIVSIYDNHYPKAAYQLLKAFLKQADENWDEGYAYLALCCLDLKKDDEYIKYLRIAVERNPTETRLVLGDYYPAGMEPKDYYEYTLDRIRKT